jgi:hypothetical protein
MERSRFKRLRFVTLGIIIFFFSRDILLPALTVFYSWKIFSTSAVRKKMKGRGNATNASDRCEGR